MLQPTHDAPVDQEVGADAFYGPLNVSEFQELYRVPASMAPIQIVQQLDLAFAEVWPELAEWRAEQEAAGITQLADSLKPLYQEAVFARAYGHLLPMMFTLYFTDQAEGIDQDGQTNEARYFARSDHFINRIRGTAESGLIHMALI